MRKWTRRGFIAAGLVSGAALIVGVAVRPGNRSAGLKGLVAAENEALVNAWVKIKPDNRVTVIVPHCEMGQGVHTSLPMMLAEEMDLDWSSVEVMEAPDDLEYANYALARGFIMGDREFPELLVPTVNGAFLEITQLMKLQVTGGSTSIKTTGVHAMKMAGAAAREMLIQVAAEKWKVLQSEIRTHENHLYHDKSSRKFSYAELAQSASQITPPAAPQLKPVNEYKIVGTSPIRLDISGKIDGSAKFGIDTSLPELLYAAVKNAPVFGSQFVSMDPQKAEKMQGVSKILKFDNFVAVIASNYWLAEQALQQLEISWTEIDESKYSSESIFEQFDRDLSSAWAEDNAEDDFILGDVDQAISTADRVIEAEYRQPFLAHATMEPLNCTAEVKDGHCEVWTGTQNPLGFRSKVAQALSMDLEKVKVHNSYLGGGFGRRSISDYAVQAALIARELDRPVKMIWSREEDTRHDYYRQASTSRFKASFDKKGRLSSWTNMYVDKHEPEEAPHIPYQIENQKIQYIDSPTRVPFGPWRSVDHSLHAFFTESFIDELAVASGQDPYVFRVLYLQNKPRILKVLTSVAELSKWGSKLAENCGRGIAVHQSFGTIVAQVAEISIDANEFKVERVYCAVDCGLAINPDGLIAQMESGIIFGLTAALNGEISIEKGSVKQSNFHDYKMVRMDESPTIKTMIINSGESLGGAGEPATPPIMAAVGNALFDVTGKRHRKIPFRLG